MLMKDIEGYEGRYAITDEGDVYSYLSNKILKTRFDKDGYKRVTLYGADKSLKTIFIHQLVANAFIPNPENLPTVNHKNEIKTDNRKENLEWMSVKDQINYGTRTKRAAAATRKPVRCIETGVIYSCAEEAVKDLGKSNKTGISNACNGKYKTAYGYHWEYVEVK